MKKKKPTGPNKLLRKDIELKLTTQVTELTALLGKGSKKLKKEIEKGARKLAKKLSKEITPPRVETEPVVTKLIESAPVAVAKKPAAKVKAVKAVK